MAIRLTGKTRNILALAIAAAVATTLFPPWHWTFRQMSGSCGYSFVAVSPDDSRGCSIDMVRLLVEWAVIGGLVAVASLLDQFRSGQAQTAAASFSDVLTKQREVNQRAAGRPPPTADEANSSAPPATPSAPRIGTLPPGSKPGVQPPIFLQGREQLTGVDRAFLYNLALIQVEQERRERERRISVYCHRRLNEATPGEHSTLPAAEFPTQFSPVEDIRETLKRVEALGPTDQTLEAGTKMLREWIARREEPPDDEQSG